MSSAGGVRAGRAYVEITADDTPFQRKIKGMGDRLAGAVKGIGQRTGLGAVGSALGSVGKAVTPMLGVVTAVGAPLAVATRSAMAFTDQINELKGSVAGISTSELESVRNEAMRMSSALRVGPEEAAAALTLLIKAGMSVEDAINGAGTAAVEFARVSGVEVAQAAEFMKVSMNVFGLSAADAVDTLSAAADASETDIAAMVEGFSQIAGVAKGTNQSLFGVSQAMAVLARYGIRGEEAGTGLKTVLTKLLAPTDEAKTALASMGLSMESFVDASGKMLPMSQIAGIFAGKMAGMSTSAREAMMSNEALVKVFDVRGIKIIQAFADAGVKGFSDVAAAMEGANSVSQKYADRLSGLSGSFSGIYQAFVRLGVVIGEVLAPAFKLLHDVLVPVMDALTWTIGLIPRAYRGISSFFSWGSGRKNNIKRDATGTPMSAAAGAVPAMAGGKPAERDIVGTFNGGVLGQLGIGPSLAAAQATADNTARMADSLDQIKMATAQASSQAQAAASVAGQPARGASVVTLEREMLSAAERSSLTLERIYEHMRLRSLNSRDRLAYQ